MWTNAQNTSGLSLLSLVANAEYDLSLTHDRHNALPALKLDASCKIYVYFYPHHHYCDLVNDLSMVTHVTYDNKHNAVTSWIISDAAYRCNIYRVI